MFRTLTTAVIATIGLAAAANAQTIGTVQTDSGIVIASAANGMTLYTFRNDGRGTSNCYNDCATAWPPFLASASAAPEGALTIIARQDGGRQWALNGQPLYFWAGDSRPGDVTGDGVGGVWDAVRN